MAKTNQNPLWRKRDSGNHFAEKKTPLQGKTWLVPSLPSATPPQQLKKPSLQVLTGVCRGHDRNLQGCPVGCGPSATPLCDDRQGAPCNYSGFGLGVKALSRKLKNLKQSRDFLLGCAWRVLQTNFKSKISKRDSRKLGSCAFVRGF